jgi:hypothetical protein
VIRVVAAATAEAEVAVEVGAAEVVAAGVEDPR